MKKVFIYFLILLVFSTVWQGCGSVLETGNAGIEVQDTNTVPAASVLPAVTSEPESDHAEITAEMAYNGVFRYCQRTYGSGMDGDAPYIPDVTMGEETDDAYQVIFHSYTDAYVYFYVDKISGITKMVEYAPIPDTESDAGSFQLLDYLSGDDSALSADTDPVSKGHYVFQPRVCSVYMEEVFGKTMCETWFRLVDAVLAGEDTFACPDKDTYNWVMGQFRELCFPVLTELIDYTYDRPNPVKNGVADFTWLVPKEQAVEKIASFATQIEGILNDALEDDYSDFEKALALYHYFSEHYSYDYETEARMYEAYVPDISGIRFFHTGTGVCQEISTAYSYLLMQAGVDATVMKGQGHQWSYVRIGGKDYHIDPTFVLSSRGSLSYFMMDDEQRTVTGYEKKNYLITSVYAEDHPHPAYLADDDTFRPLWNLELESFSHQDHILYCNAGENDYGEWIYVQFDYSGY